MAWHHKANIQNTTQICHAWLSIENCVANNKMIILIETVWVVLDEFCICSIKQQEVGGQPLF